MRRVIFAGAALLASCSNDSAPFEAGQWLFSFDMSEDRQLLQRGAVAKCIDKSESADLPVIPLSQTDLGKCTATQSHYKNGKLSLEAICGMTGPSNKVSLQGSYTSTRFEVDYTTRLEFQGSVRQLSSVVIAHREGNCATPQGGNAS